MFTARLKINHAQYILVITFNYNIPPKQYSKIAQTFESHTQNTYEFASIQGKSKHTKNTWVWFENYRSS